MCWCFCLHRPQLQPVLCKYSVLCKHFNFNTMKNSKRSCNIQVKHWRSCLLLLLCSSLTSRKFMFSYFTEQCEAATCACGNVSSNCFAFSIVIVCCARLFGSWFARSKLNQFSLVTAAVNSRSSSLKINRGRRKVASFSFLRKANSFILCSSRSVKFFPSAEIFCVFNRLLSDSGNHYQK